MGIAASTTGSGMASPSFGHDVPATVNRSLRGGLALPDPSAPGWIAQARSQTAIHLAADRDSIEARIDIAGDRLIVRVPRRLAALAIDDLNSAPVPQVRLSVNGAEVDLGTELALGVAHRAALERAMPRLVAHGSPRNANVDRTLFADVSADMQRLLDREVSSQSRFPALLATSCLERCTGRAEKTVADGLAAATLTLAHAGDARAERSIELLAYESTLAVGLRVARECADHLECTAKEQPAR